MHPHRFASTNSTSDRDHLQLLGLRMDSLKRNNISEDQLRSAFSDAVVGNVGRCSDFSALQFAFKSLLSTVRKLVPKGAESLASVRVKVTGGTYVGKRGTIVRETPSRVVVRLDDGGEVCLASPNLTIIDSADKQASRGFVGGSSAAVISSALASGCQHDMRALAEEECDAAELLDGRPAFDDGYCESWSTL